MADVFDEYWDELEKDENSLFDEIGDIIEDHWVTVASVISFFYLYNMKDDAIKYNTFMQRASAKEKRYVKQLMKKYGKSDLYKSSDIKGAKINVLKIAIDITEETGAKGMSAVLEKHFSEMAARVDKFIKNKYNIKADGKVKLPDIYGNQLTNSQNVSKKLLEELKNGIIKGERYEDISKTLKKGYEKRSLSDVKKIVRTEGTAITNAVGLDMFQEEGYTEYKYSSVIDSRTTEICRNLDGDIFKISQAERGVNFPPMHVNCRSGFEIVMNK